MSCDVRPASMERITNEKLAAAFIEEQVKQIRQQVGDKKFCWPFPAVWTLLWLPRC